MQTFLPFQSFTKCAQVLDYRRLGKQRVEASQILDALHGKSKGWRNHPVTFMWEGFEDYLTYYMNEMIREWERRGYENNMRRIPVQLGRPPAWLSNERVFAAYRHCLMWKDYEFYGQYGWMEGPREMHMRKGILYFADQFGSEVIDVSSVRKVA